MLIREYKKVTSLFKVRKCELTSTAVFHVDEQQAELYDREREGGMEEAREQETGSKREKVSHRFPFLFN